MVCSLHVGLLRLSSAEGVSRCAPYMLVCEDCHRQRVCHGVLSACWSVKIGIGRGLSRCALCMLDCEDWHWQGGALCVLV